MKLGKFALVSLMALSACAVDGADDVETGSTEQGSTILTLNGCRRDVLLDDYPNQQVVVQVPAINLILNNCVNADVEARSSSRHYLISVDWKGTTGQCPTGWLSDAIQHTNGAGWVTDGHDLIEGVVTSQNPPLCVRPKSVWNLMGTVWNRVIDRSTWFDGSNYNLVDSTVTYTPE
jgi:hypothetical protein